MWLSVPIVVYVLVLVALNTFALAELLAYVEDARTDESVALILKLVDLVKLYYTAWSETA